MATVGSPRMLVPTGSLTVMADGFTRMPAGRGTLMSLLVGLFITTVAGSIPTRLAGSGFPALNGVQAGFPGGTARSTLDGPPYPLRPFLCERLA